MIHYVKKRKKLKWEMADGKKIALNKMNLFHLQNALSLLERRYSKYIEDADNYVDDWALYGDLPGYFTMDDYSLFQESTFQRMIDSLEEEIKKRKKALSKCTLILEDVCPYK